jgi:hypothetical protein
MFGGNTAMRLVALAVGRLARREVWKALSWAEHNRSRRVSRTHYTLPLGSLATDVWNGLQLVSGARRPTARPPPYPTRVRA